MIGYRTSRWIARNTVVSALVASILLLLSFATIATSISASRFRDLATELEGESKSAMAAKDAADDQTRIAKRTLLAAQLSDAKSSSVSRQVGRKTRGLAALKDAIRLSRELGKFETHRREINSTAAVLGSLHDVESVHKWETETEIGYYRAFDFNGNLSQFAYAETEGDQHVCKVFNLAQGTPKLIEKISTEGTLWGMGFCMSDDGRILVEMMLTRMNGSDVVQPWIYDRKNKKTFTPEPPVESWDFHRSMKPFHGSPHVAYLTGTQDLAIFDVEQQRGICHIDLPDVEWKSIVLSADDRFVAVYQASTSNIAIVDLQSKTFTKLDFAVPDITAVAWRPDGKHLAIATKRTFPSDQGSGA